MGVYKYWNPVTQQYEIIKSKAIINPDGTNEYTPDMIKSIDGRVGSIEENINEPKYVSTTSYDDVISMPDGSVNGQVG